MSQSQGILFKECNMGIIAAEQAISPTSLDLPQEQDMTGN